MSMGKWQPIETAPMWELVIVYDQEASKRKSSHTVNTAVQVKPSVWDLTNGCYIVKNPTHWMPLPEPPKD